MDKNNKSSNKVKRIIILILVLLLLAAGVTGVYQAMRLRLPEQAMICGVDVSNMLLEDAEAILDEKVNGYTMKLTVGDQSFTISAADLGITFLKDEFESVVQSVADTGIAADPWSVITLDKEKLTAYINENFNDNRTAAIAPEVVWDESESCFKVKSGEPESWYSGLLLADMVYEAVANLETELEIPTQELYMEQTDAELQATAEAMVQKANALLELELEYVFNPRRVELGREVIDGEAIASFLRFDLENNEISVDESVVLTYIDGFASKYAYNTYKDRFVTHGGDRIDLTVDTRNLTVDQEALAALIAECVIEGASGSFEVPYAGPLNFDDSYIEVSIPEQHLWVYVDGEVILESDVVTGNVSVGHDTPTGIHFVRGHLTQFMLAPGYYVEYWMSFSRGGWFGFHDADHWREPDGYGGDIYLTNGSGGCVNVPVAKMKEMYDLVPDGMWVIIYNQYHYDD